MAAEDVQSLHEHGVDLRIDSAAAAVPAPAGWWRAGVRRGPGGDQQVESTGRTSDRGARTGTGRVDGHASPAAASARWRRALLSPLAARSYPAQRARSEEDCEPAHALSARSRPDRALQGISSPDAQDPGVRGARGRSLPHAPHTHAGGDADLAHRGARAGAQRGPDRGDRAGPRPRASTIRSHRRGGAGRLSARALRHGLSPLRALAAGGRAPGARGARPEPHRAGARRDRAALQPRTGARDARGADRARDGPRGLHQPRHRRRAARGGAARSRTCPRGPIAVLGGHGLAAHRHAGARHGRTLRAGRLHHAGGRGGRGDGRAARVHVQARLPGPRGARRARAHRRSRAQAVRALRRAPRGAARRHAGSADGPVGPTTSELARA